MPMKKYVTPALILLLNIVFIGALAWFFLADSTQQEEITLFLANTVGTWGYYIFMTLYNVVIVPFPNDPFIAMAAKIFEDIPTTIFLLTTAACTTSATIDYVIGYHYGTKLTKFFENHPRYDKCMQILNKHGAFSIGLTAITPLPYSLLSWLCGIAQTSFWPYIISATLTRAVRNGVVFYSAHALLT